MSNCVTKWTVVFFLAVLPFGSIWAQKADRRPVGPDTPPALDVPAYPSLEAFLSSRPEGDLKPHATYKGQVTLEMMPARKALLDAGKSFVAGGDYRVQRAQNGSVRWLEGKLAGVSAPAGKQSAAALGEAVLSALASYASVLRLDNPGAELRTAGMQFDELGQVHVRFEQVYEGVPVWGRELVAHVGGDGEIFAVNGAYEPTPAGADVRPGITADAAAERVVSDLKAGGRWAPVPDETAAWIGLPGAQSRLVLYPDGQGVRPAYEVTLHPNLIELFTYLVDARSGAVITRFTQHCSFLHEEEPAPVVRVSAEMAAPAGKAVQSPGAAGFADATATDLLGNQRSLRVYDDGAGAFYSIWDFDNYDAGQSQPPNELTGGALTIDARNSNYGAEQVDLFYLTSGDNTWTDASGVSAHVNMFDAYTYFQTKHGRNAIDSTGSTMISIINVARNGQSMENAFWNGRVMAYGNGGTDYKPMAGALDVAGHEMTHGVIGSTAGLIYQFQSGALNESFADVFGILIDEGDYLLGEDIIRPETGKQSTRSLSDPGSALNDLAQPDHMDEFMVLRADQDNGGVHYNSGIPNKAAYLIIEAIGRESTGRIYYRALTKYLTRNSQFIDARNALVQAARDLFGEGAESAAVRAAYDAVGITSGDGVPDNDVPPPAGSRSVIALMDAQGQIILADMSDPDNVTFAEATGAVGLAGEQGPVTQLSTPEDGKTLWYVNEAGRLAYVDLETMEAAVFDQLQIRQPGDLWNAFVAPGENYVVLVSAYDNDPNLYISDGQRILATIPLTPEGTQEGEKTNTIAFADAVSISPNKAEPRVAFDALNRVLVGETETSFWAMYELDAGTEKIYSLVPAQPAGVSVANVMYSNTNPDVVAYNRFSAAGGWDVVVANFETGSEAALSLGSRGIEDAQRPAFSPDDRELAFTSPAHGQLLILNASDETISGYEFGFPVYHPRWFIQDAVRTDAEAPIARPGAAMLKPSYPNPVGRAALVRFEIPASSEVQLDVYDVLGRRVAVLESGRLPAGAHEAHFDASGLASGTYVLRLVAGGAVETQKLVVAH